MAGEFVGGALLGTAFSALYGGVKELIRNNHIYKLLLKGIISSLDSLEPLIRQIQGCNNEILNCSKEELQGLEQVMKEGAELVDSCLKVSRWNLFKKYKYATKFLVWDESLRRQLVILRVQETRDVKKIAVAVEKILNQSAESSTSSTTQLALCKVLELPPLPRLVVGLDVPLKELKSKLLENDGASMLVLTAPGGCGKTTLATMFCQDQQVKDKFNDNIIFVTLSQKGTLNLIVQRICEHKGFQVPTLQNEVHAVQWLHTFFKKELQSPLLLVLDDVWSGSESLLENFQFEISNCKILVTSRSEFPRFGFSYHLKLLDDANAMKLFCHSACLGNKISHIQEELSRKIVKHCNGFPLAITVVGRSLCRQPIEIWRKKVTEWSKGSSILDSETKLLLCLKSSLDALDKKLAIIKECFLDLGSFPEDDKIPVATLIDMWAELYDLDEETLCFANVYELSNRSLVTLEDERWVKVEGEEYYDEHYVKQHDLLRELAIYHTKLDPVEQRKRVYTEIRGNNFPKWWREQKYQPIEARLLSISTDADEKLSIEWPDMQLPEAEVLILHFQTEYYALPEFVQKMEKLKVLIVHSPPERAELSNFELLGLLSNLKRIRLERIFIPSITKKQIQLRSLRKLSLSRCHFGQTFNKMSDAFPNLEELNIEYHSGDLPAELWDIIHLKRLSITYCYLDALPEGIGNLVNLHVLRLRGCIYPRKLPGSIRNLKKLNFLDLYQCYNLEELPEHIGEMSSLKKLDMRRCDSLKELPMSVFDLNQLEEVICDDFDTKHLWEPFLSTLKNIRLVIIHSFWPEAGDDLSEWSNIC